MQRFARHGLRQAYNTTKVKVATYILVQRAMIGQYCVLAILTRIAITEVRRTRRGLLSDAYKLKGDLQRVTAADDFSFALGLVDQEKTKTANETKTRQMRKFEGLMNSKNRRRGGEERLDSRKVVRNLSERTLTESETDVLALGLNFAVAPKAVPVVDIIAAVEVVGTVKVIKSNLHDFWYR